MVYCLELSDLHYEFGFSDLHLWLCVFTMNLNQLIQNICQSITPSVLNYWSFNFLTPSLIIHLIQKIVQNIIFLLWLALLIKFLTMA
jgi:hypothetical protein